MSQELQSLTQAALLFAAVFVLMALGLVIVRKFRDAKANEAAQSSDLMTQFRDLHDQGGLSDEEFRTIKSKLAAKLKSELNEISTPPGKITSVGTKSAGS